VFLYIEKVVLSGYISPEYSRNGVNMAYKNLSVTYGAFWHGIWQPGRIEPNRRLYDYELVWFSSGAGRVIIGDKVYKCLPGSVIIIPPAVVHCTVADTAVERWCIHFDWYGDCPFHADNSGKESYFVYDDQGDSLFVPSLAASAPGFPAADFPYFCRSVPPEVYEYIRTFFQICASDRLSAIGHLMLVLGAVFNAKRTHFESPASVLLKAKSIIDREFSDCTTTAGSVAASCNVSINYLNTLFKRNLGVSTTGYILSRRLEYACTLLSDSSMTVKEISALCGFNDHNYFCRLFKAKKGVTAGEMRKETAV